ncbi:MAG: DUF885 domain-containing protein [Deltaproteobacteria bacterium]|jgi:uncharacterized protein (DUF885 family)
MTQSSSALAACTLALVFACASAKPPSAFDGPPLTSEADRRMAMLAERFLDRSLELDPVAASYVGYHKWDGRLPDYSARGIRSAIHTLQSFATELRRIDRSKLSLAWAIDHELIQARIEDDLFVLRELRPFEWNVNLYNEEIGAAFYYLSIPPKDAAEVPARLDAIVARAKALPRFVAVAKSKLVRPPKIFTQFVIQQNPGNRKMLAEVLPPLFAKHPEHRARFEAVLPAALTALDDFQAFLEGPLLERSDGDYRLGRSLWEKHLLHTLGAQMSSDDLYLAAERGLELTRLHMYDLALPLFNERYPDDKRYLSMVGDERINHVVGRVLEAGAKEHGTPETFFADVKKTADSIRGWLEASKFMPLPPKDDNFVIEPTPAFLDGLAVAFFNPAPAFDPDAKKAFWISTVPSSGDDSESYLREYNKYAMEALTIHEALPGHYVQLYWSSRSKNASVTKRVLESSTMAEGWAVMVEQLVHEAGYRQDQPLSMLFSLKMRLRIFINAMIDAKLHTSDDEGAEAFAMMLMTQKGFQEEAEATRKLRRAQLTATQLSTYFVGYREMLDLYRRAAAKGGDTFDRSAFLAQMIGYGTIYPRIIERLLQRDGWL